MKKTITQLILLAIALTLSFALMRLCGTAPVIAFAYLLFFTTLRSITSFTLTRDRILQLLAAAILCIVASFWTLTSSTPILQPRHDATLYSILWRSTVILLCVFAILPSAAHLAARFPDLIRRPIS